jgi:hypothetical protein
MSPSLNVTCVIVPETSGVTVTCTSVPTTRAVSVESDHTTGGVRLVVVCRQAPAADGQESTRLSPTRTAFNVTGTGVYNGIVTGDIRLDHASPVRVVVDDVLCYEAVTGRRGKRLACLVVGAAQEQGA